MKRILATITLSEKSYDLDKLDYRLFDVSQRGLRVHVDFIQRIEINNIIECLLIHPKIAEIIVYH